MICPGTNRRWIYGTSSPVCPVCHRGPRGLGVTQPRRDKARRWLGVLPPHVGRDDR